VDPGHGGHPGSGERRRRQHTQGAGNTSPDLPLDPSPVQPGDRAPGLGAQVGLRFASRGLVGPAGLATGEVKVERRPVGLRERSMDPPLDGDLELLAAGHVRLASDPLVREA
jgi:hypothetical protein